MKCKFIRCRFCGNIIAIVDMECSDNAITYVEKHSHCRDCLVMRPEPKHSSVV